MVGRNGLNLDSRVDRLGEMRCGNGIDRQNKFLALGFEECVRHAAADNKRVAFFEQVGNNVELVRDLCAAEDSNERTGRIFDCRAHDRKFFFDKESAHCGFNNAVLDDRRGGRVRAVRRAERVVDVNFRIVSERLAKTLVLAFFFPVEAQVFEQHSLALFERGTLGVGVLADNVGSKSHLAAQKLVKAFGDGRERELFGLVLFGFFDNSLGGGFARLHLFLVLFVELDLGGKYGMRLAHVRAQRNFCARIEQIFDSGERAENSVFVGDNSVFHRHVEIATDKHALAFYVHVTNCLFVHYSKLLLDYIA